jgi:hypothetical protein
MQTAVARPRRRSSPLGRLVLVGILAGTGWWIYAQATTAPPVVTRSPVPSASPPTAQLAAAEHALQQAQQSGKSVAVTLTFTDADLTAAAQQDLPTSYGGFTLSDPAVRVDTGTLTLTARAQMGPLGGPLSVSGRPSVSNGQAAVMLDTATVAGVPLPDQVRASIDASIEEAIASLIPAKLRLTSIVARPGVLVLQATAQP